MGERIFISSVQKELQVEWQAVRDFVRGDPLLRRFFDVFLFEDMPASDRRADDVYLDEVGRCAIYLGLFGEEYGSEDETGVAPTEREFDQATAQGKVRFILVKGTDDARRHPKMRALITKAGAQLIRRRFPEIPDLTAGLYASLVEHLERSGKLRTRPFDASACLDAETADISAEKVRWFLGMARRERQYPLREDTSVAQALTHLNLLDAGQPTHAAVLLFGSQPQCFLLSSEVKCLHFHGTEVRKPIPSYQVYRGTVFELVDQAMIEQCREAGLPEPEFRQDGRQFVQTIWRDWLTGPVVAALALSSRQMEAVRHATAHGRITNAEYRTLTGLTSKTAARDLDDLVTKGILLRIGERRGTHYVRASKSDMNGT